MDRQATKAHASVSNKDKSVEGVDATLPAKSSSRKGRDSAKNTTLEITKCPLFCCFYAEFDNKVGPVVSYESPLNFMEQRVESPLQQIHSTLKERLTRLQTRPTSNNAQPTTPQTDAPAPANHRRQRSGTLQDSVSSKQYPSRRPDIQGDDIDDNHDEPVTIKEGSLSIFDSCSEYIITGNELTGNLVNLSTHHFHILSRPTVISDERYERNSLLFAVGFVLRRAEDPRPFRPILSKLALTLRDIEVESQFLSTPATRPQLQRLLDHVLVSFNSTKPECSLYLNSANYLSLKLFQPPSPPAAPVPDYAVPLLLRRDYSATAGSEWDLSINWVLLHIDGMANAKQISVKSEVDMEMVRACLRVLKHHGVIACVDMFRFSNRYETTAGAASLLSSGNHTGTRAAKESNSKSSLRQAAVEYCVRRGAWGASSSTQVPSEDGVSPTYFPLSPTRSMREGSGGFSAGSDTNQWMPSINLHQRKEDYHEVKEAISELYSLFRRDTSIGDVWLGLVAGTILPSSSLNWKRLFGIIDHRRFVSFGIVHGLIRRVHRFPILVDRPSPASTPEFSSYIPPPMASVRTMDGISPERHLSWQSSGGSSTGRPTTFEHAKMLNQLSTMLDGRHCDDELVTHFERPLEELLDLFPGRRIVSVYSPLTTMKG